MESIWTKFEEDLHALRCHACASAHNISQSVLRAHARDDGKRHDIINKVPAHTDCEVVVRKRRRRDCGGESEESGTERRAAGQLSSCGFQFWTLLGSRCSSLTMTTTFMGNEMIHKLVACIVQKGCRTSISFLLIQSIISCQEMLLETWTATDEPTMTICCMIAMGSSGLEKIMKKFENTVKYRSS